MSDDSNSSSPNLTNSTPPLASIANDPIVLLNLPVSTKLTRTNYLAWQCQIIPLLHGYGLYKYVDPTTTPPSPTTLTTSGQVEINPTYLSWQKQDQLLLGWLRSSLSESLLGQTASASTALALWDYLQKTFSAASRAQLSALHRKLRTTTKGGSSCSDFIQQMRSTADELSFIGAPVTDDDLMRYILEGLGSEFNPIVVTANARSEPFALTDLMSLILSHESLLQTQISSLSLSTTNNPTGFYSNANSRPIQHPRPASNFQHPRPAYPPRSRSTRPPNLIFNPPGHYMSPPSNFGPPLLPNPTPRPGNSQWAPFNPNRPPPPISSSLIGPGPQQFFPNLPKSATCQICSKRGHSADECWHRYDSRYGLPPSQPTPYGPSPTSSPFQAYVALPSSTTSFS